jgi:hypothetical protein
MTEQLNQAATDLAQTAADQAQQVSREAARQARDLVSETRTQLNSRATAQHRKVVDGLRQLSDQLDAMAGSDAADGVATELVVQTRDRVRTVADWLGDRQPGDLLGEVRTLARRRPGAFLLSAAVAGVVAGRITRGAVARRDSSSSATDGPSPITGGESTNAPGLQDSQPTQVLGYTTPPNNPVGYSAPPPPPVGYQPTTPHGVGR